jgi:hypothetical protein
VHAGLLPGLLPGLLVQAGPRCPAGALRCWAQARSAMRGRKMDAAVVVDDNFKVKVGG